MNFDKSLRVNKQLNQIIYSQVEEEKLTIKRLELIINGNKYALKCQVLTMVKLTLMLLIMTE